ncbi:MAG: NDP-sugar synthase [Candidatus Melainabacteria bacterium]|nr:NDP-sugar synthase [Candidatus Melainabacteria bacterium]
MKAMVLAAGVGSRLDPLTTQIPKPLVPVANRPVMEHLLRLLKHHGVTQVVSNLHYLPERLVEYFGNGSKLGLDIQFYLEEKLSGDAGGVRACKEFLHDETFLVLMGDLLTDIDLSSLVKEHKKKGAIATIAVKQVADVSQFGVVLTNEQGFITGFQEKPDPKEALSNLASTGIYILEPEVFQYIPQNGEYGFGRQLFPALVSIGAPVLGIEVFSYWSDVGTLKQYRLSNFDALKGLVCLEMPGVRTRYGWVGEGSFIDDKCEVSGLVLLGSNSRLGKGVKICGHVVIGDNTTVADNAYIEDSVIWSNTCLEKGAHVKDSVIGCNCVVANGSNHLEVATVS